MSRPIEQRVRHLENEVAQLENILSVVKSRKRNAESMCAAAKHREAELFRRAESIVRGYLISGTVNHSKLVDFAQWLEDQSE